MDGLLLVDKQPGITSHDVVDLVRKYGRQKKAGHAGTLDPAATGLLVLCLGRVTRLQAYLMKMEKTYEGTIRFGWATSTWDAAGDPIGEPEPRSVEGIDFEPLLERFRGEFDQMPPAFSAKKIEGVRAYELARRGERPALTAKRVRVDEFTILAVDGSAVRFRVRCSAGTYVRAIANDLGEAAGIPAHLENLRRTATGPFGVEDAVPSGRLGELGREGIYQPPHFVPASRIDLPFQRVFVDPSQERRLMSGQAVIVKPAAELHQNDLVSVTNLEDELVAIGEAVQVLRAGGGPVEIQPRVVLKG